MLEFLIFIIMALSASFMALFDPDDVPEESQWVLWFIPISFAISTVILGTILALNWLNT